MCSTFYVLLLISIAHALDDNSITENPSSTTVTTESSIISSTTEAPVISCTCGVFLSGQFKKGSKDQPKGNPALLHEQSDLFPCSNVGNKMCTNKCLDVVSRFENYFFLKQNLVIRLKRLKHLSQH